MEELTKQVENLNNLINTVVLEKILEIKQDVEDVKQELEEVKQDVAGLKQEVAELKQDVAKIKQKLTNLETDLRQEIREVRETLFLIEYEHGKKIDAMYDFLNLQNDRVMEKAENVRKLDKRMERNEINIFNLEKRVTILENRKL